MTEQTQLKHAFISWDVDGGGGEYMCGDCAETEAQELGLIEDGYGGWKEFDTPENLNEHGNRGREIIKSPPWHDSESDTPQGCLGCDVWLDVALTSEAIHYMKEREFPAYVFKLYGI